MNSFWMVIILLAVIAGAWFLFFRSKSSKEINIEQPEYGDPMPVDQESPMVETFPSISNPDWSEVEEREEREETGHQVDEEMVMHHAIGMSGYLTKEDQEADRQVTHVTVGDENFEASEKQLSDIKDIADLDPVGDVVVKPTTVAANHFKGKLTDDEVRAIRSSDKTNELLAIQYDCSTRTIQRIKNRDTYKHVEDLPA